MDLKGSVENVAKGLRSTELFVGLLSEDEGKELLFTGKRASHEGANKNFSTGPFFQQIL